MEPQTFLELQKQCHVTTNRTVNSAEENSEDEWENEIISSIGWKTFPSRIWNIKRAQYSVLLYNRDEAPRSVSATLLPLPFLSVLQLFHEQSNCCNWSIERDRSSSLALILTVEFPVLPIQQFFPTANSSRQEAFLSCCISTSAGPFPPHACISKCFSVCALLGIYARCILPVGKKSRQLVSIGGIV